jgi:hypothetical protein
MNVSDCFQRFVDRDMLMRYHYGLGVGHTYSHSSSRRYGQCTTAEPQDTNAQNSDPELPEHEDHDMAGEITTNIPPGSGEIEIGEPDSEPEGDESEHGESSDDDSSSSDGQHEETEEHISDEQLLAMDEMYGSE